MNDVQSLMTAAAILAMGGLGLFMYKGDEVAFSHEVMKSEQNSVPHGGKAPVNPPFPPLFPKVDFQKGDTRRDTPVEKQEIQEKTDEEIETEIKPKKTRKMRKRSGGGSRRSMSNF